MSRVCILSGKRAQVVNSRSHSNIATKRKQHVNLQMVMLNGQRLRLAARTVRTLKKMAEEMSGVRPSKMQKKAAKTAEMLKVKAQKAATV